MENATRRRGAKAYFGSSLAAQILALLRYMLLARLLGPEQLGLGATLILMGSFFDLVTDLGGDRFLIQDKDGDTPEAQALVHLAMALRGTGIAIALVIFAWPIAWIYNGPQLAPALMILGLSPLISGFYHTDMRRAQRHNDFRPESISSVVGEVAGMIGTIAAAYFTHSFTAVLYGMISRAIALVIISHVLATRPYHIAYSRELAPRLAHFSAPLMANGLILFFGGQGDRVLIGRLAGFASLGFYSAVMLLIFYPSSVVLRYAHAIYLPVIAGARDNKPLRRAISDKLASQTFLLGIGMAAGFALVAPFAVVILYGKAFAMPSVIISSIGVLQASRFIVLWPTTVALSMGRTAIVLASNVVRLAAWPAAGIAFLLGYGMEGIVVGFASGEFISFTVALAMLNRREGNPAGNGFGRFATFIGASAVIIALSYFISVHSFIGIICGAALAAALSVWIVRSEFATIVEAFAIARRVLSRLLPRSGELAG